GLFSVILLESTVLPLSKQSSADIFNQTVGARKVYLETEMTSRWSNFSESEAVITGKIEKILEENNAIPSDIKNDYKLNEKISTEVTSELIYILRKHEVTGAFVILNGKCFESDTENFQKAGVYIRDLEPTSFSKNNSDLLLERGLPSVSKQFGISLDNFWKADFDFSGDSDQSFFHMPLNAALNSTNKKSSNYGYWSNSFELSPGDVKVITYSIPIILSDGSVVGVMGIDLTQNYIQSKLNYDELAENKQGAYFLGCTKDNGATFEPVFFNGPIFQMHFGNEKIITANKTDYQNIFNLTSSKKQLYKTAGSVQYLHLYNNNTPFENSKWVVVGLMDESTLFSYADAIHRVAYSFTFLCLILGIIAIYGASKLITVPITNLIKNLRKVNPNSRIRLKRVEIDEIDELVTSIETLSNSVADSSSKISKILTFAKMPIGVFEYEKDKDMVFCSQQMFELLDLKPIDEDYLYISTTQFSEIFSQLEKHIVNEEENIYKLPLKNNYSWLQMKYIDDGVRVLGVVTDITKDMLEKERMEYELSFDLLTNILNRRAFEEKVRKLFEYPSTLKIAALLMCDLDNLKYINDTYGHDYGDDYIQAIGHCLSKISAENCVAARRSGDEFYVFFYGYNSKDEIRNVISSLWEDISKTSILLPNNATFGINVSGGIAWYPDDSDSYDDLLRFSDFAMYSTKHSKKGNIQEFCKKTFTDNGFLISGHGALNRLIDQELLNYALQPIVSTQTGEIYGFEMLMRGDVTELKNPENLLRLASSQSKLYDIERLTWFKSLETCKKLLEEGRLQGNEKIFVNSISNQILTDEHILQLEENYGDILKNVVIEFIESQKISDELGQAKNKIAKRWGALTAIDDFGSGYNNESTLVFLSPNLVKIDMTIVHNIDIDTNRQALFESIVSYTGKRNIKILAEGVETKGEMETVIRLGAQYIQGYYVGTPSFDITPIPLDISESIKTAYEKYKI
ncbi:MAG: EAL domain-containing protein, partial [Lachnospiraceae bacterium]|nr:EAL domain-containing protein [Lachnospiraceae bacterium]